MEGSFLKSLKLNNIRLAPLLACVGVGAIGSVAYLMRLAFKSPDVSWAKSRKSEPWEDYRTKQYKFFSPTVDYSKIESPAPKYLVDQ